MLHLKTNTDETYHHHHHQQQKYKQANKKTLPSVDPPYTESKAMVPYNSLKSPRIYEVCFCLRTFTLVSPWNTLSPGTVFTHSLTSLKSWIKSHLFKKVYLTTYLILLSFLTLFPPNTFKSPYSVLFLFIPLPSSITLYKLSFFNMFVFPYDASCLSYISLS